MHVDPEAARDDRVSVRARLGLLPALRVGEEHLHRLRTGLGGGRHRVVATRVSTDQHHVVTLVLVVLVVLRLAVT